jgi:TRAP-type transport system periplasmic protein
MAEPIKIRMGGYGPPSTSFSRSLKLIGDTLSARFGDRVSVDYIWNIMDHGHRAEDILTLVENGAMTLGYQSSSYLTDRVPELGFVDLPFLFERRDQARAAIDGELGRFLAHKIEARVNYCILGTSPIVCAPSVRRRILPACAFAYCRAKCRPEPSSFLAPFRCAGI